MSTDPTILLRMLEPAVRPVGPAVGGSAGIAPGRAGDAPFEKKPFDQLLLEAREQQPKDELKTSDTPAHRPNPLAPLGDFARIENASLREQLEQTRATAQQLLSDSPERPSPPE